MYSLQRDRRFRGDIRYPLPAEKATVARIGKGGNGFVFTLYHEKRQYAVKKVQVYILLACVIPLL